MLVLFQTPVALQTAASTGSGGIDWSPVIAGLSVIASLGIWASTEWRMRQWRQEDQRQQADDETPKLTVILSNGSFVPDHLPPTARGRAWNTLNIEARNTGKVDVTVGGPNIRLLDHDQGWAFFTPRRLANVSFATVEFPYTIKLGTSVTASIRCSSLSSAMKDKGHSGPQRIIGMYESQIGGSFPSHAIDFDVDRDWWAEDKALTQLSPNIRLTLDCDN